VQLTSFNKKLKFISNAKQRFKDKISLSANNIHTSFKNDPVYLNSILTKENYYGYQSSTLTNTTINIPGQIVQVYLSKKMLEPKQ